MKQDGDPTLVTVACDLRDANAFVRRHHRHHPPVVGHKFSLAVTDQTGLVRGVAIVSRPVARGLDDGWTAEVSRVATDGCRNACSALYGAAWRTAKAMGFRRLVTYTLTSESGASLRGAGWRLALEQTGHVNWDCPSRPRTAPRIVELKRRWQAGDDPPYPATPDFGAEDGAGQLALPLGL